MSDLFWHSNAPEFSSLKGIVHKKMKMISNLLILLPFQKYDLYLISFVEHTNHFILII